MTKKGTASRTPTGPVDAFWAVSNAGKELARLHIDYETLEPWPLKFIETTAVTPASRRHPVTAGTAAPRAGRVRLAMAAASSRTPKPAAAGLPLSYRVEGRRGREKGSEFNFFTRSRIPQRL